MRTLEAARITLCQPADAPPAEVLRAAKEEVGRLSDMVQRAKNVQQRNGAKKKLAELTPLMGSLEVEVELADYEKAVRDNKSGNAAQRAAVRVQAQKLSSQIAALSPGEEKDVFQQWFTDLNTGPALAAVSPAPAPPPAPAAPSAPPPPTLPPVASEPPAPPILPPPAPRVPPAAPDRPRPPTVDRSLQLFAILTGLEQQAKSNPPEGPAALLRELESLRVKVDLLPAGPGRTELQQRSAALGTALRTHTDAGQVRDALGRVERAASQSEFDAPSLLGECDLLVPRLEAFPEPGERMLLLERLNSVRRTVTERHEISEIESALKSCFAQNESDPGNPALAVRIAEVSGRIQLLKEGPAKTAFLARIETMRGGKGQPKNEGKISKALDSLGNECTAGNTPAPSLQAALQLIATQVKQLTPGPARLAFEQRIRELGECIAKLDAPLENKLQPATVLRLEPIPGRAPGAARPLVFVARDRFAVGRKPETAAAKADLLTPTAEPRISRVHVTFLARAGKIQVFAGEEGKPSTNPALVDETPLSSTPVAVAFHTERRLDLTGVLVLTAKHMPSVAPYGPPLRENHPSAVVGSTMMMPPISGCLRVRPQGEDLLPNQAVWIFTDATIGAETTCAITVAQVKLSPEEVRVHYWKKSFWIEALRNGSTVALGGKPLSPGASEALNSGQELRLGDGYYRLHLS